jgi:DNA-binding response OmpR family regulator
MSARAVAALSGDARLAPVFASEKTADWVSLSRRVSGTIVVVSDDPVSELAYVATAGVRGPIILAMDKRYKHDTLELMEAGAAACITLPLTAATIKRVLPVLARGTAPVKVDAPRQMVMDPISRTVRVGQKSVKLSQREFAVLHCLSAHSGRPVSADELLRDAWDESSTAERSRQILDVYIFHLRKKLAKIGLKDAINTVRKFGYELI